MLKQLISRVTRGGGARGGSGMGGAGATGGGRPGGGASSKDAQIGRGVRKIFSRLR